MDFLIRGCKSSSILATFFIERHLFFHLPHDEFVSTSNFPVRRSRHASTNSRAPVSPSQTSRGVAAIPAFLLSRMASVSRSPPSIFQLSHIYLFIFRSVGFSPPHQIFIEGETAQAGWARALPPPSLLIRLPNLPALNLADSLALSALPQEGSISGLDTSKNTQ